MISQAHFPNVSWLMSAWLVFHQHANRRKQPANSVVKMIVTQIWECFSSNIVYSLRVLKKMAANTKLAAVKFSPDFRRHICVNEVEIHSFVWVVISFGKMCIWRLFKRRYSWISEPNKQRVVQIARCVNKNMSKWLNSVYFVKNNKKLIAVSLIMSVNQCKQIFKYSFLV